MKNLLVPGLTFLIGVGIILLIPHEIPASQSEGIGSRTLPYILSSVIACAGLLELVRVGYNQYSSTRKGSSPERQTADTGAKNPSWKENSVKVLVLGITVFWAYSLEHLGHFVVSSLLSVIMTISFGLRRPVVIVVYTTVLVVVTYYLFSVLLGVRLPGLGGVFN